MGKGLIALLAGALILAGCGSGGETSTVRIARAVFVKRADAICERTYKQVLSRYQSFIKSAGSEPFSDIQKIEKFADTVLIPAKRKEVEELRALGLPSGEEDRAEAILAAYEDGIDRAEESPRDAVTSSAGVFVKATELAKEFGLAACRY